jgi:hypothetical protein
MGRVTVQATRVFVPWTARVTARPRTGNKQAGSGRTVLAVLPFLALLLIFATPLHAMAANEKDLVLPGSGIYYPGGFDMNTVGIVQGKVYGIHVPESGPVQFLVATGRETFTVLAAPFWFWSDLKGNAIEGMDVQVRGSKSLGRDGKLYMIAQEVRILSSGKTLSFRDDDGFPSWHGGEQPGGGKGGFGSPMRGDGAGRGAGAGGRGRR